jgi:hypothetical protein
MADKVMEVPEFTDSEQSEPQRIPVPLTVPVPVPDFVTVRVFVVGPGGGVPPPLTLTTTEALKVPDGPVPLSMNMVFAVTVMGMLPCGCTGPSQSARPRLLEASQLVIWLQLQVSVVRSPTFTFRGLALICAPGRKNLLAGIGSSILPPGICHLNLAWLKFGMSAVSSE